MSVVRAAEEGTSATTARVCGREQATSAGNGADVMTNKGQRRAMSSLTAVLDIGDTGQELQRANTRVTGQTGARQRTEQSCVYPVRCRRGGRFPAEKRAGGIYLSERFIQRWKQAKLKGLDFIVAWDSDLPPEAQPTVWASEPIKL